MGTSTSSLSRSEADDAPRLGSRRGGDVVCRLRLDEHGRQANRLLVVGARIGDAAEELEKLVARRMVYGTEPAFTASAWATFARKYGRCAPAS
jgi:hypothetical protein